MDKVVRGIGHVVVYDVRDVLDVDAAGGDVGGDEDAVLAGREAFEGGGPLRLRAIAVDGVGVVTEALELFGDAVGAVLGAREDEKGALLFRQHLVEQAEFLILHDGIDAELDLIGGLGGGADLDADGLLDVVLDDLGDVGVEGRGVAHGLAGLGEGTDDAADSGEEAHVEHAVYFVEDEHVDGADVNLAAAEEVFEATGGSDDEARTAINVVELSVLGEAATDEDGVVLGLGDELGVGLEDLHGELAGGEEDEGADGSAFAAVRGHGGGLEALDHGDQEGEGLAGAGGGGGKDVLAFEGGRDGLCLDGSGGEEAGSGEAGLQRIGDVEVCEVNAFNEREVDGGGGCGCGSMAGGRVRRGLRLKSSGGQVCSFVG